MVGQLQDAAAVRPRALDRPAAFRYRSQPAGDDGTCDNASAEKGRDIDESDLARLCAARLLAPSFELSAFRIWLTIEMGLVSLDSLLAMMTATARHLGDLWVEDLCRFEDVTLGMHRLTMLMIAIETGGCGTATPLHGERVFLALGPDDQHSFGLSMTALRLRGAGWDVALALDKDHDGIVEHLSRHRYPVVGFSIGHDRSVAPMRRLIADVRRHSCTADQTILVGGPMIATAPELGAAVGADLWAADGQTVVAALANHVEARPRCAGA